MDWYTRQLGVDSRTVERAMSSEMRRLSLGSTAAAPGPSSAQLSVPERDRVAVNARVRRREYEIAYREALRASYGRRPAVAARSREPIAPAEMRTLLLPVDWTTEEETPPPECCICTRPLLREEAGGVVRLSCSELHRFHRKCVEEWLARQGTCPLCRQVPSVGELPLPQLPSPPPSPPSAKQSTSGPLGRPAPVCL